MEHDDLAKAYSPPGSDVNAGLYSPPQDVVLADRSVRLLAVTLDGVLASVPFLPMLGIGIYILAGMRDEVMAPGIPGLSEGKSVALLMGAMGIGMLGFLGIAIYQWVLISRTGQTLGKKWTGIRIEKLDGGPMEFYTGVFIRNWIPKLIGLVLYLGTLFQLLDVLWIFRQDRRCIHDHMAHTRVVRLQR